MNEKAVLDACCGSRMFWFDKHNKNAVFCDNRTVHTTLCDGRSLDIVEEIRCRNAEDGATVVIFVKEERQ